MTPATTPLAAGLLLTVLLAVAVWRDVATRRIPNRLILAGMLSGIALNCLLPAGAGVFVAPYGGLGLWGALAGLATGLLLLLPMYALRALGAGDVKLIAMVGSVLGPQPIVEVTLLSLIAGGVLSLAVAMWKGVLRAVLRNCYTLVLAALLRHIGGGAGALDTPAVVTGRLAYAVAIASGTLLYAVLPRPLIWGAP